MTGNLPYAPPFDHLVYMRVFEGCNLHCRHCFIPANPKRMTLDQMARVPEIVATFAPEGQRIMLQWHGGEPTLFGAGWLERAIETIEARGAGWRWQHGIQTNLMSYDQSWADLYRARFAGEVGVSWDPEIRQTRRRDPASNADYEARFWRRMERLLADGLSPYLVVTATAAFFRRFRNPFAFFDFLTARGIGRVHLERITKTGNARENWAELGLDNAGYARHMSRFLRAYAIWRRGFEDRPAPLSVSPFDGLLESVRALEAGTAQGYGCWSGACDTRFHTIDSNGYKKGCTALTSEADNARAAESLFFADYRAARDARRHDCRRCDFRRICSSGCLALDIEDGSGECSGGWNLFDTARRLVRAQKKQTPAAGAT